VIEGVFNKIIFGIFGTDDLVHAFVSLNQPENLVLFLRHPVRYSSQFVAACVRLSHLSSFPYFALRVRMQPKVPLGESWGSKLQGVGQAEGDRPPVGPRSEALLRYTSDGRIGIDNNPAERSLRGIAVTRKNFLFLGSEAGGERAAILYTVLETAKLNGLDPEAWLADVINRMAKGHPMNRLAELLPWNWKAEPAKMAA